MVEGLASSPAVEGLNPEKNGTKLNLVSLEAYFFWRIAYPKSSKSTLGKKV